MSQLRPPTAVRFAAAAQTAVVARPKNVALHSAQEGLAASRPNWTTLYAARCGRSTKAGQRLFLNYGAKGNGEMLCHGMCSLTTHVTYSNSTLYTNEYQPWRRGEQPHSQPRWWSIEQGMRGRKRQAQSRRYRKHWVKDAAAVGVASFGTFPPPGWAPCT